MLCFVFDPIWISLVEVYELFGLEFWIINGDSYNVGCLRLSCGNIYSVEIPPRHVGNSHRMRLFILPTFVLKTLKLRCEENAYLKWLPCDCDDLCIVRVFTFPKSLINFVLLTELIEVFFYVDRFAFRLSLNLFESSVSGSRLWQH